LYTAVVTRPIPGARPVGASLWLFKIVPDDFVATVRLRLPALATFLKQLLRRPFDMIWMSVGMIVMSFRSAVSIFWPSDTSLNDLDQ
jgi:hypothetical protein